MTVEMLFSEGNHVCAVCVANENCELQDVAIEVGMDHSRFTYRFPERGLISPIPNLALTITAVFSAPVACASVMKSKALMFGMSLDVVQRRR